VTASDPGAFTVREVSWAAQAPQLRAVRTAVFVREQGIPLELELDAADAGCLHVLATARSGEGIGAGRMSPAGVIGRMAVVRPWRGRGVGTALLEALIARAYRDGLAEVRLDAQSTVRGFYARLGFVPAGPVFLKAGIEHVPMRRPLHAGTDRG